MKSLRSLLLAAFALGASIPILIGAAAPIIRALQVTETGAIYGYTNFFDVNKALMQAAWPEVGQVVADGQIYHGFFAGGIQYRVQSTPDGDMAEAYVLEKSLTTNELSDVTIEYLRGGGGGGSGTFWNGMLAADDDTPHLISVRKIGSVYTLDVSQDPGDPGSYPTSIPVVADDLSTHSITIRNISGVYVIDLSQ